MMLQVVCEGDTETFLPCSEEHGGGTYAIRPSGTVINAFVRVVGKRMICRCQTFPGHCAASAGTAMGQQSGWFRVAGVPVCVAGDRSVSACHASLGIVAAEGLVRIDL
ncbi:MAG: hypothetical protein O0X49_01670 [Methanocorpusculum sp.]|nr:hypothetical protein [Methanocorpusculum sp.]